MVDVVATPQFTIFAVFPPDPLTASVTVRVHDGTIWVTIAEASTIRIRQRHGGGQASFFIPDATIARRTLVRYGRECEIVLNVDGNTISFGGYTDQPQIKVRAPGHFDIAVKVVDLTHGATWFAVRDAATLLGDTFAAATDYIDIIKTMTTNSWVGTIDVTGVDANPEDTDDAYVVRFDMLGRAIDKIVKEHLKDWVWWVGHNGSDGGGIIKKLFAQARGANDLTGTVTIGELDIGPAFTMIPVVSPRDTVIVVGDDDPTTFETDPLSVTTVHAPSTTAYGTREMIARSQESKNALEIAIQALAIAETRNFDLQETKLRVFDWTLKPNDKILLYLPSLGIEDAGVGVPWVVQEVEDQFHQGRVRRWLTLKETVAAATTRVS